MDLNTRAGALKRPYPVASWMWGAALMFVVTAMIASQAAPPAPPGGTFGFATGPAEGGYSEKSSKPTFVPDTVLVTFEPSTSLVDRFEAFQLAGLDVDPTCPSPYFYRLHIRPEVAAKGVGVHEMTDWLNQLPGVRYAEPDFIHSIDQTLPNDPLFPQLYGLHNIGQSGGTVDADVDAPEAWQVTTGSNDVIVAVIDTGVDYNHPDLAANILRNASNQVVGFDFVNNDADPMDDNRHGTHCAGTIGAIANNAIGVTGVAHQVKIMPLKFLSFAGSGSTSNAILSIDFARNNGAHIMSNSWGGGARSQTLIDAIARARDAGILFVAAAGNNGRNVDTSPSFPASYNRELNNVVSVAATDWNDNLASFSNFGLTVDVAAPGVDIVSTVPLALDTDGTADGYTMLSGTSMACPHVAGLAALIKAVAPGNHLTIAHRMRLGAEPRPSLAGRIMTGRINAINSLDTDSVPPAAPSGLALERRSATTFRMRMIASGDDGNVGAAMGYDLRVSRNPITEANFASATAVSVAIPSAPAGTRLNFALTGLFPGDPVFVAARAFDNLGNVSPVTSAGPFTTLPALWIDRVETPAKFTPSAGSRWAVVSAQSASPPNSWSDTPAGLYSNNVDVALTCNDPIQVSGPMALQFFARLDLEANFDFLHLEVSTDGGAIWQRRASWTSVADWRPYSVPLIGFDGQTIRFRFRMTTDGSITRDGVHIDDIHVIQLVRQSLDNVEGGPRFTGDSPWAITTARSFSPTRAWEDSPGGPHANSIGINLTSTDAIAVGDIANPQVSFLGWIQLERNFDFLRVQVSQDGGPYLERAAFTGPINAWQMYSATLGLAEHLRLRFRLTSDTSIVNDGVYIDDIAILGEPYEALGGLAGTIDLDGYTGPLGNRPVQIELVGAGGFTQTVTLGPTGTPGEGAFDLPVTPGTYDLIVRGGTWLQRRLNGVVIPATGLHGLAIQLVNGNVDGAGNAIDIDDYLAMAATYEVAPPTNPNADLNGDGAVDGDDFFILAANYGLSGDN